MKKVLLNLALLLVCCSATAQEHMWAKNMGGSSYDNGKAIAIDNDGNIYTTGSFSGTADFDPGQGTFNLTSSGGAFIQKLDASGKFIWAKAISSPTAIEANAIVPDNEGNLYLTGYFMETVDFDPNAGVAELSSVNSNPDIFVLKLDTAGNYVWAKSMESSYSDEEGRSIALDGAGHLYVGGYYGGTNDFDPGTGNFTLTAIGAQDIFVLKLDTAGRFKWAKSMGGTDLEYAMDMSLDASMNIYIGGFFWGTADFDPGTDTLELTADSTEDVYNSDYFIVKLDSAGDLAWAQNFGGAKTEYLHSLAADTFGNIYAVGQFEGTADFDGSADSLQLTSFGISDVFIQKLDANGNLVWARQAGGLDDDFGTALNIGPDGNVYACGSFADVADFDPGPDSANRTSVNYYGIFVLKLDASGDFVWVQANEASYANNITHDTKGNVYVTGNFGDQVDFDPGAGVDMLNGNNTDIFIWKLAHPNFVQEHCEFEHTKDKWTVDLTALNPNCTDFRWSFGNGDTAANDPQPQVTYDSIGTYTVCFECLLPVNCLECVTVEIEDTIVTSLGAGNAAWNNVNVYPNPSNGKASLRIGKIQYKQLDIYTQTGSRVFSTREQISELDLSTQPKGVYFIQLQFNDGVVNKKLIIQ